MNKGFISVLILSGCIIPFVAQASISSVREVTLPFVAAINTKSYNGLKFSYDLSDQTKIVCRLMYVDPGHLEYSFRGNIQETNHSTGNAYFAIVAGHVTHMYNHYRAEQRGEIKVIDDNKSNYESYANCYSENDSEFPNP